MAEAEEPTLPRGAFAHPNADVRTVVESSYCARCGASRAEGLMMVHVDRVAQRRYRTKWRCLRCGAAGVLMLTTQALEPGEEAEAVADPIDSGLVIDVHRMTDDQFAKAYAKLTSS